MRVGSKKDARRIGQRGRHAGKQAAQMAEAPNLAGIERIGRVFRAGQMAHQQADAMGGEAAWRQRRRVVKREAKAVHAGVDMQRRGPAPAGGGAKSRPFVQLVAAAEHRTQAMRRIGRRGGGQQGVEHVDVGIRRHGTRPAGFRQQGDEEGAAAGGRERAHHRLDAAPIGVGLDDGGTGSRRHAGRKVAPIGDDRREIDRQDAAGLGDDAIDRQGHGRRHIVPLRGCGACRVTPVPTPEPCRARTLPCGEGSAECQSARSLFPPPQGRVGV